MIKARLYLRMISITTNLCKPTIHRTNLTTAKLPFTKKSRKAPKDCEFTEKPAILPIKSESRKEPRLMIAIKLRIKLKQRLKRKLRKFKRFKTSILRNPPEEKMNLERARSLKAQWIVRMTIFIRSNTSIRDAPGRLDQPSRNKTLRSLSRSFGKPRQIKPKRHLFRRRQHQAACPEVDPRELRMFHRRGPPTNQ